MDVPPPIRIPISDLDLSGRRAALAREWLVTNGLGGYASGTIGGAPTRRYHGLLVASLPAPYGRRLLLCDVIERLVLPEGRAVPLADVDGETLGGGLTEFRLELGLPIWRYEIGGIAIEKRIVLPHAQNTVHVVYRLLDGADAAALRLTLVVHHRSHDAPVDMPVPGPFALEQLDGRYELGAFDLPRLRLLAYGWGTTFTGERGNLPPRHYAVEEARGYRQTSVPWTPGYFRVEVRWREPAALVASTEPWDVVTSLGPDAALDAERERRLRRLESAGEVAGDPFGAQFVLAADQFIVKPVTRSVETARLRAEGAEGRTVIAGYHWFTDWGRDTMISLEGLALATGRHAEAGHILRTFAHSIRDGLLPNLYPEGEKDGLYHAADATLWLFHAIDRYLATTGDRALLPALLPQLVEVAERHVAGTRFGIAVDPDDGLLEQGAEGYQLTWMDAKIDDWVVTPRRGKAVEINALWYNALCVLARWLEEADRGGEAAEWRALAAQVKASFNARFWNEASGCLYDVVDGELGPDPACRPNQVFAISLPNPVLEPRYWRPVLEVVRRRLLTPFGLRSLAPGHPDYRARYDGDVYSRDAAYHQGTVWPWLLGPFVDAWLKAYPADVDTAYGFLEAPAGHLRGDGLGTISELFDSEPPYAPRGCISQAWSVAEVLRSWSKVRAAKLAAGAALDTRAGPHAVEAENRRQDDRAAARQP